MISIFLLQLKRDYLSKMLAAQWMIGLITLLLALQLPLYAGQPRPKYRFVHALRSKGARDMPVLIKKMIF